ncbi:hypothetical protein KUCAC02_034460, partial [Chaenocephalus aceratus]
GGRNPQYSILDVAVARPALYARGLQVLWRCFQLLARQLGLRHAAGQKAAALKGELGLCKQKAGEALQRLEVPQATASFAQDGKYRSDAGTPTEEEDIFEDMELGESCSHIGGLLYKAEMIVRVKEKVVANNAPARRADPQPVSSDGFEDFLVSLLAASNPVMPVGLSLFGSTSSNFAPKKAVVPSQKAPPGLRSLYRGVEGFKSLDEVYSAATQTMTLDHKDVERIGNVTKLQSKSLVWYEQRAGRITSSVSHSVLCISRHSTSSNPYVVTGHQS